MISIEKKLEEAHRGYAYELLQLQMAVEDEKLTVQPSITEITKLIQLYMIGVEVLESIADPRFVYFHNKIHSLMLKKHIVKKLHDVSGQTSTQSMATLNKAQMKGKKDEYEINCYFNQGQIDIKKVKEILENAKNKQIEVEGKIHAGLKKQEARLEERIKERKMRSSEAGSVRKFKLIIDKQTNSPNLHRQGKDPRMEYFDMGDTNDSLIRNKVSLRATSGSLEKNMVQRKLGWKNQLTSRGQKVDFNDAI